MEESLQRETEKLGRSWMRHEAGWLRDYLVAGVEDPRLNLQSIFSRHFLARAAAGDGFGELMEQEYRFAAVMNWLVRLAGQATSIEELAIVLEALRRGADNAEGIEISRWLVKSFATLPARIGELSLPNYVESFLMRTRFECGRTQPDEPSLNTFQALWQAALSRIQHPVSHFHPLSVLEPACGSANDYRFLRAYGLARLVDYTGLDLCATNIENARTLFPGARFETGNVFALAMPDQSFDLCFVHDLFEHLSLKGLHAAVEEICRVTRQGLCVSFFNMDEIAEHVVQPVEEYHWNTLSLERMRELFASLGFVGHVIHIGAFLRQQIGCVQTHNPNAYTWLLSRPG